MENNSSQLISHYNWMQCSAVQGFVPVCIGNACFLVTSSGNGLVFIVFIAG